MTQGGANPKGIAIRPLRSGDEPAYRRFCDERFGPDGYQGRSNYLQWLYIDNPAGRGFADCLLATEPSGAIVACIHRMRLSWQINAGRVDIPSLHNLVAEPSRGGAGFFVLMAAVRGETHALIPGVVGDLAQAYARMRYQRV